MRPDPECAACLALKLPVIPTPTPTPKPPGYEAVFGIAGLLAVAYLVLRRKRKA